jgi:phosphoribosylformimino-5-aminoimidazole carboxamide ribonucleotide (ProFAR) isomerase
MSYLELLPAVDVKDGRAVRLVQGELAKESIYGAPLDVALEFQAAGAEWLHLVDLDAAFGRGENSALLAEVVGKLDIKVELSGGIRLQRAVVASILEPLHLKIPNGLLA